MSANDGFMSLLAKQTFFKVTNWVSSSGSPQEGDREEADVLDGANVVSSRIASPPYLKRHTLMLDLDVPAYLVPSSTPGHSHLYVDVAIAEEPYFELLDQLAKCGVIELGYAEASRKRGGTHLRLPWVNKYERRVAA